MKTILIIKIEKPLHHKPLSEKHGSEKSCLIGDTPRLKVQAQ